MITGYFTDIGGIQDEEIHKRLLAAVNSISKEKTFASDPSIQQYRKIAGKLLLYRLLAAHNLEHSLFADAQGVNSWGKPYFANTNFDYNLSHSGSVVFCAGGQGAHIGVDIEKEEERDILGMRDYFSGQEWDRITSSENMNAEFCRTWVRKEACIKAIGKGIFQPLNEIDVCEDTVISGGVRWYLQDVVIKEGYAACIATDKKMEVSIAEIDLNTLLA